MLVSMFRKYRTVWLSKGYGFLEINYFKIVLFFFFLKKVYHVAQTKLSFTL